jgi:predicted transcriptional regulator
LKNKGTVELIIPQNIFKELIFRIDGKVRRDAIKKRKLKVYKFKQDLNLYLSICDENIGLGLFKNDGSFDQNRILISSNKKSHEWSEKLFEHIRQQVI